MNRDFICAIIGASLWFILGWDISKIFGSLTVTVTSGSTLVSQTSSQTFNPNPLAIPVYIFYIVAGFILIWFGTEQK